MRCLQLGISPLVILIYGVAEVIIFPDLLTSGCHRDGVLLVFESAGSTC